jgi:phage terminase large subunit GpA-like protein
MIGVDAAKDAIYSRLRILDEGPSYCHFPLGRDLLYFEQLTSEKKITRYHNGYARHDWKKDLGARNEALDCRVYAYAALHARYAAGLRLNEYCARFENARKVATPAPSVAPGQESEAGYRPPLAAQRVNPFTGREGFLDQRNWFSP